MQKHKNAILILLFFLIFTENRQTRVRRGLTWCDKSNVTLSQVNLNAKNGCMQQENAPKLHGKESSFSAKFKGIAVRFVKPEQPKKERLQHSLLCIKELASAIGQMCEAQR